MWPDVACHPSLIPGTLHADANTLKDVCQLPTHVAIDCGNMVHFSLERAQRLEGKTSLRKSSEFAKFTNLVDIVRPYAECPLVSADEVSMEITYAQVVNRGYLPTIGHAFDPDPAAIVRAQQVADPQESSRNPSAIAYEKGVLGCRADDLASHVEVDNPPKPNKHLLDLFFLNRAVRIRFRSRNESVANPKFVDSLETS